MGKHSRNKKLKLTNMDNATNKSDGLKALIWIACLIGTPTIVFSTGMVVNPILIKVIIGVIFAAPLFFNK